MASFFKRAATSALRRREEVRDTNQFNLEADSDRAVKFLATAETERLSKKKVLDSYDKITGPVISKLSADFPELPGSKGLEAVVLNAYIAVRPDGKITGEAINNTTRILKETLTTTPTAFDSVLKPSTLTSLGSDASKGLRDITDTPSPDTPYSIKSEDLKSQTVRMLGDDDDLNLVGRTATTAFNVFLGLPATSVPQLTKKRYGDMFGGGAAGEEAYEKTLNYIQDVSDGNDDTEIPDIPPELAARLYDSLRVVKGEEAFEERLKIELDSVLKYEAAALLAEAKISAPQDALVARGGVIVIIPELLGKTSADEKAKIYAKVEKANLEISALREDIKTLAIQGWKAQEYSTAGQAASGALKDYQTSQGIVRKKDPLQAQLQRGVSASAVKASVSLGSFAKEEEMSPAQFQSEVKNNGSTLVNRYGEDNSRKIMSNLGLNPEFIGHYWVWQNEGREFVVSFDRANKVVFPLSSEGSRNLSDGSDIIPNPPGLSTEMSALGAVQRRPARVGGQLVNAQQNS